MFDKGKGTLQCDITIQINFNIRYLYYVLYVFTCSCCDCGSTKALSQIKILS